jgi:hypothetical protein
MQDRYVGPIEWKFKFLKHVKKIGCKRDQSFPFKKHFLTQHKGLVTMKMLFHSLRKLPGERCRRERESELFLESGWKRAFIFAQLLDVRTEQPAVVVDLSGELVGEKVKQVHSEIHQWILRYQFEDFVRKVMQDYVVINTNFITQRFGILARICVEIFCRRLARIKL